MEQDLKRLSPRTRLPIRGSKCINNSSVRQTRRAERKGQKRALRQFPTSGNTKAASSSAYPFLSNSGVSGLWVEFAGLLLYLYFTVSYSGYFPVCRISSTKAQFDFNVSYFSFWAGIYDFQIRGKNEVS